MAWSYTLVFTATATGRRNQVRWHLGDTDTNRQLCQDEEIDFALAAAGDVVLAAVIACARAVIGRFSTRPDSQTVGGVTINWAGVLARLQAVIAEAEAALASGSALPFAGGVSVADIEARDADADVPVPVFHEDLARSRYAQNLGPRGQDEQEDD